MDKSEREVLIEKIGINATESIANLQDHIKALHEYLDVVQIYGTKGFKLLRNAESGQSTSDPQNQIAIHSEVG
jgi:hypothetical protein